MPDGIRKCNACGFDLEEDWIYCPQCGENTNWLYQYQEIIITVTILGALLLALVGVILDFVKIVGRLESDVTILYKSKRVMVLVTK